MGIREARRHHLVEEKDIHAYRAAHLKQEKRHDSLLEDRLAFDKAQAAKQDKRERDQRAREQADRDEVARQRASATQKRTEKDEWPQKLAEATDFLDQWASSKKEEWDIFMRNSIGQWQRGVPLSKETVSELLKRRDTILEALEIADNMLKEKRYEGYDPLKIRKSIEAGIVGLNYESAKALIQDELLYQENIRKIQEQKREQKQKAEDRKLAERIRQEDAERARQAEEEAWRREEKRRRQEQEHRQRLAEERRILAAERKAKIDYLKKSHYDLEEVEAVADIDFTTLAQIKKKFPPSDIRGRL